MKKICFVSVVIFSIYGSVFAQTISTPVVIADNAVKNAKEKIDILSQDNINKKNLIHYRQNDIADSGNIILSNNDAISLEQQGLTAMATQNPPLQSAVDLCASNSDKYCPGYNP